jgi:hypothetical protein
MAHQLLYHTRVEAQAYISLLWWSLYPATVEKNHRPPQPNTNEGEEEVGPDEFRKVGKQLRFFFCRFATCAALVNESHMGVNEYAGRFECHLS